MKSDDLKLTWWQKEKEVMEDKIHINEKLIREVTFFRFDKKNGVRATGKLDFGFACKAHVLSL